jgi:hypothetical protein
MLEYVTLPEEYKLAIREKRPPIPKNGWHGRPFWGSNEARVVYYENSKFVYQKRTMTHDDYGLELVPDDESDEDVTQTTTNGSFIEPTSTTVNEKEYIPIEVNMRGFFCIACEPGSGPQPFIIVDVDNAAETIGLIKPYVYVVNETDDEVELKVGADMSAHQPERGYEGIEGSYDAVAVKRISEKYKVFYKHKKDIIGKYWLGVDVGTFGNHGLPNANEKGNEYQFVA